MSAGKEVARTGTEGASEEAVAANLDVRRQRIHINIQTLHHQHFRTQTEAIAVSLTYRQPNQPTNQSAQPATHIRTPTGKRSTHKTKKKICTYLMYKSQLRRLQDDKSKCDIK